VYSLVFFGVLSTAIVAFFPYLDILADLYNYGAMLSFTMTHLALIVLRNKEPDLPRPFRVPLSLVIRKKVIPLTAVFGLFGTGGVFVMVLLFHRYGRVFGTVWMIGGIFYYLWFRRHESLPVMQRVQITDLPDTPEEAVPHKRFLVATSPTRPSPMLRDVCKIARADDARITVISVIEVPLTLPLTADMSMEEKVARHTLDLCQAIGVEEDVIIDTVLAKGRSVGTLLNFHLKKTKADTLVINNTGSAISRTILGAVERSSNTVTIWSFQKVTGGDRTPTPKPRLTVERPIILSEETTEKNSAAGT
jgi:APA family basic amino acid/polyamine antiporter